ncbi:hypothetical protein KR100_09425 [Synechococcus sp. KORDI-100]|nr:hypothetical protein KR100_09425 [Synechococcus sp. KORDI-100]
MDVRLSSTDPSIVHGTCNGPVTEQTTIQTTRIVATAPPESQLQRFSPNTETQVD